MAQKVGAEGCEALPEVAWIQADWIHTDTASCVANAGSATGTGSLAAAVFENLQDMSVDARTGFNPGASTSGWARQACTRYNQMRQ